MHYGNNFFTKNGGKTISRKIPGNAETNEIGMSYYKYEGPVLSPQDVLETNLLYRCTKITGRLLSMFYLYEVKYY